MDTAAIQNLINLVIMPIANLLRGPYRPPQYRRVMLPLIVLRRLDSVLEATKEQVLAEYAALKAKDLDDAVIDKTINAQEPRQQAERNEPRADRSGHLSLC